LYFVYYCIGFKKKRRNSKKKLKKNRKNGKKRSDKKIEFKKKKKKVKSLASFYFLLLFTPIIKFPFLPLFTHPNATLSLDFILFSLPYTHIIPL